MIVVSASKLKNLKSSIMAPRHNIFRLASPNLATRDFVAQPWLAAVKCGAAQPARPHRDQV